MIRTFAQRLLHDRRWPFALLRIGVLAALGWWALQGFVPRPSDSGTAQELWPETDFSRARVPLAEFEPGGPPRDGIPAIDRPRFVAAAQAGWLADDAPVIVVEVAGRSRAYPLEILIWHEIVNDTLAGVPVAVTFCPLCNASLAFDRRVAGRTLDFGTTGWLRRSDLVMYDRQTFSWWQQLDGQALVGELAGARLTELPSRIVAFADFRAAHPGGEVLSRRTGYRRPYGENPYAGYDSSSQSPLAPSADPRLRPMQRVLAVRGAHWQRVYPLALFADRRLLEDDAHGTPVLLLAGRAARSVLDTARIAAARTVPSAGAYDRRLDGRTLDFVEIGGRVCDRQTGSQWNALGQAVAGPLAGRRLRPLPGGVHFAFAWLAFHPGSEVYSPASASAAPIVESR